MSEVKKGLFGDLIRITEQLSHPAVVISSAAVLERLLERALKTKMPSLSSRLVKTLFDDRGALNTFSAKIDLAHALDITSDAIHIELQKIRRMRNMFSHSEDVLSLDEEPMRALFYNLKRPPGITGSYAHQYMACVGIISDFIELYLIRMGITDKLNKKWGFEPPSDEKAPGAIPPAIK